MKTHISITDEAPLFTLGITDASNEYLLWQSKSGDERNVYFEHDDQGHGGYNSVQECTLMRDGIHLVLTTGMLIHFYLNDLSDTGYKALSAALERIYAASPGVLDILDD